MKSYTIVNFDFTGNDGLVTVRVRPRVQSQEKKYIATEFQRPSKATDPIFSHQDQSLLKQKDTLIKVKYRCSKTEIASLKRLLKRSFNTKEFQEFYKIYGPKLIEIDFGNIELFNVKGQNQYNIKELQQYDREKQFIRWGIIFSIAQLSKFIETQSIQDQIIALQFYNLLVRERLFTLRILRYYKDDKKRKQFPYTYLYIYDFEDCVEFNVQSFQESQSGQIKAQNIFLPLLKYKFFENQYDNFQFENIIVPFFQNPPDDSQQIQLFFVHFNKSGYKFRGERVVQSENIDKEKKYQCYIFVDFDTTYYNQQRLVNGVQDFANIHNFELTFNDIQFVNLKNQGKCFLEEYVDYIETEFFQQQKGSTEDKMNYIFKQLPKEISKKSFNDILDPSFIIPQNVESIMAQFFGN
ncbi:unnamed protein product (macronuclear) [Paramecium tetraurelia]|uniref:Uncharacterized protein n=1 Tax=Paramecium tetraurelia TaxID=5888 RepID=A0C591_PARTE|nr:uncharacterized protein GSPATT00006457001 [Paramecium tetraurelia]CAK65958.1 unnamed protein product [Paramecium tetraurelia]|eukprot:XP_001433355.1 hypothetical protein (macronuclear) [Paramecium tetraurelia strain d4-2]